MRKMICACLGLALLLPVAALADGTASIAKNVGASSQSLLDFSTFPVLSVQLISNSKKKRLLVVTGTANCAGNTSVSLQAKANGVSLAPQTISTNCALSCTLSGTFWLDLDDAEIANPTLFYNKLPLGIDLIGSSSASTDCRMSVTAQLLKQ